MLLALKTFGAIALLSLVLPLLLWASTGHLRNSLRAWWSWWKYMGAAVAVVGGLALVTVGVERMF